MEKFGSGIRDKHPGSATLEDYITFCYKHPIVNRKRKRKSRWEAVTDKIIIPGLPTQIPQGLNKEQEEAYLRKYF
jgi:hypothetical protein